ncbi:transposase [Actinoallomurus rhizosphaericola]|uniref:transposase n=1 Tax=Actinoallomurus rhizosphaericola TaxID=2952536 RepID=UPI002093B404|nr:transposase [Actinoallomurus rhizosphaericola]MCO5997032.1 transposase [Actinoallomurus rhizosphaericola]
MPAEEGQLGVGGLLVRVEEGGVVPARQADELSARGSPCRADGGAGRGGPILRADHDQQRAAHAGGPPVSLLGVQYRPALADLPDQKGWRINTAADYGPLNTFARGKIDLGWIRTLWPDILRVVASIYTGHVRAYDVVRMLQRDGHPTALGEAIASYGRIHKTLHICTLATEKPYRRDVKAIRNLQEGRHALAANIFHGKKGELYQRYHKGMEDRLGALGLILNCVVLWNTRYINAAVEALRAQGYPVLAADVARLSLFVREHLNVIGKYNFALPDLGEGGIRPLRAPDADDEELSG